MGLALTLWLDYNSHQNWGKLHSIYTRIGLLTLAMVYAFSIAYSRLFLGVHSINQVLWGL